MEEFICFLKTTSVWEDYVKGRCVLDSVHENNSNKDYK